MDTTPITVGTAGHIDHGKTQLVEQLTGMRADRPYERERGMTIDIGYAEMEAPGGRRIGFVDLPGHERFIRNMVAGATGIDLALLVVAADDGVMPQTREHVEILELLGVRRGLVVLNKIDLVDEEMRELALEELRDFVAETSLRDAPVLSCSAVTGEGVDAVRQALLDCVAEVAETEDPGAFFLAVQRTFAATGFGCIVTGVPAAGAVATGDDLELLPSGKKARVRAIQVYHEPAEQARAGHRTALNLSGVSHDDVARGMVVAAPGCYEPSRHIAVRLKLLPSVRRPIRHAAGLRFLTGTLEEMAHVYLPSGDVLKAGADALVEIRTKAPVTVRAGSPFIVRSDNAKETLGGGLVVAAVRKPLGRKDAGKIDRLEQWESALDDAEDRLRVALAVDGPMPAPTLAVRCQLDRDGATKLLLAMEARGEIATLPGGAFVRAETLAHAVETIPAVLQGLHEQNPLVEALPLAQVRDACGVSEAVFMAALQPIGDQLVVEGRTIRLTSHAVELDPELQHASERVLACLDAARFAPPARDQLPDAADLAPKAVAAALTFLHDRGSVREVAPGVLYSKRVLDEGIRLLKSAAQRYGAFEPPLAKSVLGGISRKWLIPLLEYYDKIGATRRDGNARMITRRGDAMVEGGIDVG